jgi:putative oxidoreductase
MNQFSFPSVSTSLKIFRIAVSVFMLIHGITRITNGTVGGFGEFLTSFGFPFGFYVAWGITLFEIIGTALLMSGYFATIISLVFVVELTMGILMVHYASGWFVVGAGNGGMEYSVLLIVSFLLIAATNGGKKT